MLSDHKTSNGILFVWAQKRKLIGQYTFSFIVFYDESFTTNLLVLNYLSLLLMSFNIIIELSLDIFNFLRVVENGLFW